MEVLFRAIKTRLFGIDDREITVEQRGFRCSNGATQQRLESIGQAFLHGYHSALATAHPIELEKLLNEAQLELRGFAFEGAAMGLVLLDWITPWKRNRFETFLRGPAEAHTYMAHVGAGWVMARAPGGVQKFMSRFDPLLRWLLVDGYGFHEAFFNWRRYFGAHPVPKRLQGFARRVFDQGFGRGLWFVDGADINRIAQTIGSFSLQRRADLWSGVGLACVYAGEITETELHALRHAAGPFLPQLAQGAAFAAKARQRAGSLTPYQDVACGSLCGMKAADAASVTDGALENLSAVGEEPAYEIWRGRIQQKLAQCGEVQR